jgi:hypothetical protein
VGLTLDAFEFASAPPTQAELATHLREQMGAEYGLERLEVEGSRATLYCMLDTLTRPYAIAFLLSRGGVRVHHRTGEAIRSHAVPLRPRPAAGSGRRRPIPLSPECGFRSADSAPALSASVKISGFCVGSGWPTGCRVGSHTTPRNNSGDCP